MSGVSFSGVPRDNFQYQPTQQIDDITLTQIISDLQIEWEDDQPPENLMASCRTEVLKRCQEGNWGSLTDTVWKVFKKIILSQYSDGNLYYAIAKQSQSEIQDLITSDHSLPLKKDAEGLLPVDLAIKLNRADLIPTLMPTSKRKKYWPRSFQLATAKGYIACIDALMQVNEGVGNILHLAVQQKNLQSLEHLLTKHWKITLPFINERDKQQRTPLLLAGALESIDCRFLELLIQKGANVKVVDEEGKAALLYAVSKENQDAVTLLIRHGANYSNLTHTIQFKNASPRFRKAFEEIVATYEVQKDKYNVNFYLNHPEGFVFKGGGPKAIAYLGALKELEDREMMDKLKRVGGTSAGAIMATLVAVKYGVEEMRDLIANTSGKDFGDHPFTMDRLKAKIGEYKDINELIKACSSVVKSITNCVMQASPLPLLQDIIAPLLESIWNSTGVCQGEELRKWIEKAIKEKTGIDFCTFGELKDLVNKGQCRHLHVIATRISKNNPIAKFSSEDKSCENFIISDAVRASGGFPGLFEAFILMRKVKEKEEIKFYSECGTYNGPTYEEVRKNLLESRKQIKCEYSYIDGGLLKNFPMDMFDQKRFVLGKMHGHGERTIFNNRILGFDLFSEDKELKEIEKIRSVGNWGDLIKEIYRVYRYAESNIRNWNRDPRDQERIIRLDIQDVSLIDFGIDPTKGKGEAIILNAQQRTKEFFDKQEEKIKGLRLLSGQTLSAPKNKKSENESAGNSINNNIGPSTIHQSEASTTAKSGKNENKLINPKKLRVVRILNSVVNTSRQIPNSFKRTAKKLAMNLLFEDYKSNNKALQLFDYISNPFSTKGKIQSYYHLHSTVFHSNETMSQILPLLAYQDNPKYFQFLNEKSIQVNCKVNSNEYNNSYLIHLAVKERLYGTVKALIRANDYSADRTVDGKENTILHYIAENWDKRIYDCLEKENKLNDLIDKQNEEGKTAFHIAIEKKNIIIFKKLLENPKIDLTILDYQGKGALHLLVELGREDLIKEFIAIAGKRKIIVKDKEITILKRLIEIDAESSHNVFLMTGNRLIQGELIAKGFCLTKECSVTKDTFLHSLVRDNQEDLVKAFFDRISAMDGCENISSEEEKKKKNNKAEILDYVKSFSKTNSAEDKAVILGKILSLYGVNRQFINATNLTSETPLHSLANLHNSCYMNASLQVIFNIPPLLKILENYNISTTDQNENDTDQKKKSMVKCLKDILDNPKGVNTEIQKKQLLALRESFFKCAGWSEDEITNQHDAPEFLQGILNILDFCPIQIGNKGISCDEGTKGQINQFPPEPQNMIAAAIDGKTSFQEILNDYFGSEFKEDWKADDGKVLFKKWEKRTYLANAPEHLLVHLKRYNKFIAKDKTAISFLQDSVFTIKNVQENLLKYEIISYINHVGEGPNEGHYTAVVKSSRDNNWWRCSDSVIEPGKPKQEDLNDVYVVLLKKID